MAMVNDRGSLLYDSERLTRWMTGMFRHKLGEFDVPLLIGQMFQLAALQIGDHYHSINTPGRRVWELRYVDGQMALRCGPLCEPVYEEYEKPVPTADDIAKMVMMADEPQKWSEQYFDHRPGPVWPAPPTILRGIKRLNATRSDKVYISYFACTRTPQTIVGIACVLGRWQVWGIHNPKVAWYMAADSLPEALADFREECRGLDPPGWVSEIEHWVERYRDDYSRRVREAKRNRTVVGGKMQTADKS